MTFSLRSQSINIPRLVLIDELKKGLEAHKIEYQEALEDYKKAVLKFPLQPLLLQEKSFFQNEIFPEQKLP